MEKINTMTYFFKINFLNKMGDGSFSCSANFHFFKPNPSWLYTIVIYNNILVKKLSY
jgi:hypothetical protein